MCRERIYRYLFVFTCASTVFMIQCRHKVMPPDNMPASMTIVADEMTTYSGGSVQINATAIYSGEKTEDVTDEVIWSNAPSLAGTMVSPGVFHAFNDGVGIETVRADFRGLSDSLQIEIVERARTFSIWPREVHVAAGRNAQIEAVATYAEFRSADVTSDVSWTISPGVAAVIDENGLLTASSTAFGTETVTAHFQGYTDEIPVIVEENVILPFDMISIPAGTFLMGDDSGATNEIPAHDVTLDAFEIGRYEVTNQEYVRYLNSAHASGDIMSDNVFVTGCRGPFASRILMRLRGDIHFPDQFVFFDTETQESEPFSVRAGYNAHPVIRLTWFGAMAFCMHYGLRLPTEAEWERACRGDQSLTYGTEDGTVSGDLANTTGTSGLDVYAFSSPVGTFPPNPFGLYDMCGNAAEYVFDQYLPAYYSQSPRVNPQGPGPVSLFNISETERTICRGGCAVWGAYQARAAYRGAIEYGVNTSLMGASHLGFRVARSVE